MTAHLFRDYINLSQKCLNLGSLTVQSQMLIQKYFLLAAFEGFPNLFSWSHRPEKEKLLVVNLGHSHSLKANVLIFC